MVSVPDISGELPDVRAHDRVRAHTAHRVNERIDRLTEANVQHIARQGRGAIHRRLSELDREWDVDRVMQVIIPVAATISLQLGRRHRFARYAARAQLGWLAFHAFTGWSPPMVLLRRLGVRSAKEIETERQALLGLLESPEGVQ
ncbi:MAG: hypothetical protein AB2A00_33720 [Myxococcota bacterium]